MEKGKLPAKTDGGFVEIPIVVIVEGKKLRPDRCQVRRTQL